MPLADVLATLGTAITSDADPETVRRLIVDAPDLTPDERNDLLRIPFNQLCPYQSDFYRFETDMIRWGFEYTWACLRRLEFGDFANDRAFMVAFKQYAPSKTHSVRELGRNFVGFLRRRCRPIADQHPWIVELAEMEQREIEVLYALDNPHGDPLTGDAVPAFFDQPLEDLFNYRVVRAEAVGATLFNYPMPDIKTALTCAEEEGQGIDFERNPFTPAGASLPLVIARDPDRLVPLWYRMDPHEADLLNALSEEEGVRIGALAEQYCDIREQDEATASDEELLGQFLQTLAGWFQRRYLLIAH
jgi:hypothetical protein